MLQFKQRGAADAEPIEGYEKWLSNILRSRGQDTKEKADRFMHPQWDQLHDPFLLHDMRKAVALIHEAIAAQKRILVYGDYDCDGVCATTILTETLCEMGACVEWRIPKRHGEGYGLNEKAVREIALNYDLLITVDCGITNLEEVSLAKQLGMQVIVTDHHSLAETLPEADAVINPLLGDYPFRFLCGAGVAFKLTHALLGPDGARARLDLAALATVADLVTLIDENRVIVSLGMEAMATTTRPGLRALLAVAECGKTLTSTDLGFRLAPRINAGGRLDDAALCVELLLCQDPIQAKELAQTLNEANKQRQDMQIDITRQAEEAMATYVDFRTDKIIIVMGDNWNKGIVGLAAGRLCEKYHYPVIVLSNENGTATGSCRSIPGINIHTMLTTCKDLFERFGGHAQAAGLTMPSHLVPELRRRMNLAITEQCDPQCFIPEIEYDAELRLEQVDLDMIRRLNQIEPTGYGNPAPTFLTRGAYLQAARAVGQDCAHLKLTLLEGAAVRNGIAFRMGHLAGTGLSQVDVLYIPQRNEFRGSVNAELTVSVLQPTTAVTAFPSDEALFPALQQELVELAEMPETEKNSLPMLRAAEIGKKMKKGMGILLITHDHGKATEIAANLPPTDKAVGQTTDPRPFNTILCCPQPSKLQNVWQEIILLDGDILPREAEAIRQQCPDAVLSVLRPDATILNRIKQLFKSSTELGPFYRQIKLAADQNHFPPLAQIANQSGLTAEQARIACLIFHQAGLWQYTPEPFRIQMCTVEGKRLLWEHSPLYIYLMQIASDNAS